MSSFQAFASARSLWTSWQSYEHLFLPFSLMLCSLLTSSHSSYKSATSAHLLQARSSSSLTPAPARGPRCSLQPQTWKAAFFFLSSVWNDASAVPGIAALVSARNPALCHITTMVEHLHTAFCRVSSPLPCTCAPGLHFYDLLSTTSWMDAWHSLYQVSAKGKRSKHLFSGVAERDNSKLLEFLRSKRLC